MSARRSLLATAVATALMSLSPMLHAATPAAAAPATAPQALVPAQSEVTFVARQTGVDMPGRFRTFSAQASFNPKALATSQIAFTVDTGSVALNPEANVELVKPEWFNVGKFPKATFQSTAIKALGGNKFEVAGKLTIKGVARDLVLPVQLTQASNLTTATGGFVLKRNDFKVGEGDWSDTSMVANEVQVKFKLVLQGVPAL